MFSIFFLQKVQYLPPPPFLSSHVLPLPKEFQVNVEKIGSHPPSHCFGGGGYSPVGCPWDIAPSFWSINCAQCRWRIAGSRNSPTKGQKTVHFFTTSCEVSSKCCGTLAMTCFNYPPGNKQNSRKFNFEDDFPLPQVGYVSFSRGYPIFPPRQPAGNWHLNSDEGITLAVHLHFLQLFEQALDLILIARHRLIGAWHGWWGGSRLMMGGSRSVNGHLPEFS